MVQTKDQRKEYMRQYRLKNKEKLKEQTKQYRLNNKEQAKQYRLKNKEQCNEYNKQYYLANKEKIIEKQKEYDQTPKGIKSLTISAWKRIGIISENYNLLYANYLAETHCDFCRIKFGKYGDGSGTFKCCDHDHDTGLFRNFLCCACNRKRG